MSLPSPAASPSSKSIDLTSTSRKRQRSQSMQSDSSTSVKRAASEGPSSATPISIDHLTHTTSAVNPARECEIDAYMAEQGEDVPLNPVALTQQSPPATNLSIEEKVARIKELRAKPMIPGDTWYVISRQWFRPWEIACGILLDKVVVIREEDIDPPDNSSLFDAQGNLTSSLVENIDVEFLPQEAWFELVAWYGQPIKPLPRSVIARGFLQCSLELRPPRLKVLVLKDLGPDGNITGPPHPYVTVSIRDNMKTLCKALTSTVTALKNVPYRIWKIEPGDFPGSHFPASQLVSWRAKLVGDEIDKTVEDNMIGTDDPFVVEFQENGSWIVDASQIVGASAPSVHVPPPLFGPDTNFFSSMGNNPTLTSFPSIQSVRTPSPSRRGSSSKANESSVVPFKSSGYKPSFKTIQEPGILGLGNMGNTCFMNSALQCLAHTKELTDYFLSGVYQDELNPDNPLGMSGAIAEAFGMLLHRIWARDSTATSYAPREFKSQLQRFAPQFSGYQQHDSQELVAFLLDGLHEDLNRVLKKPYVEKPDWEGGQDLELAKLAQKSWEGYMQRNDSVIVDLFQGQYQSTLVCPECQKVSITFDPFMYLTLPLPVKKKWRHTILYVPWDLSEPHKKVSVEIGLDASFKDLKTLIGRWMGTQPENLLTIEMFRDRFYKNLDDSVLCGELHNTDIIYCFELPCNSRQSRSYKQKDDDPFILPVIFADVVPPRSAYSSHSRAATTSNFGKPFIIAVTQDQARSVEGMYEAVIDRLQRWTINARDLFTWEARPADDAVTIPLSRVSPIDTLAEIKENGDVVDEMVIEGDIADQKVLVEEDAGMEPVADEVPYIVRTKQDIFNLRLYTGYKDYTGGIHGSTYRSEHWEDRIEEAGLGAPLLKEGDALYCEFDENMKAYYFGNSQFENAQWDEWETFFHPEYLEAQKVAAETKNRGISLDDCLAEFTKEEQLGEDDLWYCPRCKKHQQATKKFDLWKVPDILAVHLKRFSNSRALRDKIDAFVDFPIEGLDLTTLVSERLVGTRLAQSGVNIHELGIGEVEEPLIYDLYAVDEHIGGLGGGHYRAYALNHVTEQWYHFDDSFVTRAEAREAVNANAYLLFYKRRSNAPLGGKTHEKIEETFRKTVDAVDMESTTENDVQLPTPPSESAAPAPFPFPLTQQPSSVGYLTPRSNTRSTPASSPPPLDDGDDGDPPTFEESQNDELLPEDSLDALEIASHRYDFPNPSDRVSPTSSIEAEPDYDDPQCSSLLRDANIDDWVTNHSNGLPSPVGSDSDMMNPFSNVNSQKMSAASMMDTEEIPR